MLSYDKAWKCFRRLSDENVETAIHLISRPRWPRVPRLTITDIGCGDGLLMEQILLNAPSTISEVRLIDPDPSFLEEATRHVSEAQDSAKVVACLEGAESLDRVDLVGVSVVLAVHVVYLIDASALNQILISLPANTPLYVVLDEPTSVFSRLWSISAEKYLRRSQQAHQRLARLRQEGYIVEHSTITSHIDNPLVLRPDVKDAILSILCYADARDFSREEYERVEKEIAKSIAGQRLLCESACYEIVRD